MRLGGATAALTYSIIYETAIDMSGTIVARVIYIGRMRETAKVRGFGYGESNIH